MKNDLLPLMKVERKDYPGVAARIRGRARDLTAIEERTQEIIARVRREGDAALRELTLAHDHAEIGERIRVEDDEVEGAVERVDRDLLEAMKFSLNRIRKTQGQLL